MTEFEREYYDHERFWDAEALCDERNKERIRQTIAAIPADVRSLLDVGCGNGVFLNQITETRAGMEVFGLDRSRTALKHVRTNNRIQGAIEAILFRDASFDCVSCLEVIEHLPHTRFDRSLAELARVSRKYVLISVPYEEDLEAGHTQCPACRTLFNADLHLRSFSRKEVESLLVRHGFVCMQVLMCGSWRVFKGHRRYEKMFFRGKRLGLRAPNCPVCGYRNASFKQAAGAGSGPEARVSMLQRVVRGAKAIPKSFWPKETKNYWIVALYRRIAVRAESSRPVA